MFRHVDKKTDQTARNRRLIWVSSVAPAEFTFSHVAAHIWCTDTVELRYLELAYFELPLISK